MVSPGMLAAFAVAIIVIALWAGWVVRTHRGRSHVKALPLLVLALVAVFETLAVRTLVAPFDNIDAGHKASQLAAHIQGAMRYVACAWASVALALLLLGVMSLRAPNDPDAPNARVVREPRRDR